MHNGNEILSLLVAAKQAGASDLLLVAGAPPSVYVDTRMDALVEGRLEARNLNEMIKAFLSEVQREQVERQRDLDFSYQHAQVGRCRINVHYQRGSLAVAVRFINCEIPDLAELNLPPRLGELAQLPRGLVLVTGPTGSGKSTTLAALLGQIIRQRRAHVITLEDPIEFAFTHEKSIIEQREIGTDSPSFADALRCVVRQKPDVIMVGEMRDLETIGAALTAAETGHLVLASLHTNTAAQTIERIVDAFDSGQQHQVRVQLSATLKAVACQTLFGNQRDGGMVPAVELLIMTSAIARAIRDNNTHLIGGMIETGGQQGMQTLDSAIANLVRTGLISESTAMNTAVDPERLDRLLGHPASAIEPRDAVGANVKPALEPVSSPARQARGQKTRRARRPWE